MLKIFKYLKRNEWLLVLVSIVFIVVQVWLDLKLPDYMAEITTLIQTEGTGTIRAGGSGFIYAAMCNWEYGGRHYRWFFCGKSCSWIVHAPSWNGI